MHIVYVFQAGTGGVCTVGVYTLCMCFRLVQGECVQLVCTHCVCVSGWYRGSVYSWCVHIVYVFQAGTGGVCTVGVYTLCMCFRLVRGECAETSSHQSCTVLGPSSQCTSGEFLSKNLFLPFWLLVCDKIFLNFCASYHVVSWISKIENIKVIF